MKVSVLIPTYNRLELVKQSVASVLFQTYSDFEVIVLDDGSTDGTREWGAKLADPRVQFLEFDHRGADHLAEITNDLFRHARGEYVALLDSDDYYASPNVLGDLVNEIERTGAGIVYGALQLVDEGGETVPYDGPFSLAYMRSAAGLYSGDGYFSALLRANPIPANALIIRSETLTKIGGFQTFPGFPAQDYPTWLAVSLSHRIVPMYSVVTCWRRHPGQVTSGRAVDLALGALEVARHYFNEGKAKGLVDDVDWREIERKRRTQIAKACWAVTSSRIRQKRWEEARHHIWQQWVNGNLAQKLEALVAAACVRMKVDAVTPILNLASRLSLTITK